MLTVAIETITPKEAAKVLEVQEELIAGGVYNQRKLSKAHVHMLATEYKAGHWITNNQGIGFNDEGHLIDGRHRYHAIVEAGIPVTFVVVRGIPSVQNSRLTIKAIDTIDCGKVRRINEQLQIDGTTQSLSKSGAMRAIAMLCTSFYRWEGTIKLSAIQTRGILTLFEPYLEQYYGIFGNAARMMPRSAFFGPVCLYATGKPRKAEQFVRSYQSLEGLESGSPVKALLDYFRVHKKYGTQHIVDAIHATALALYHYENGDKVKTLRRSTIGTEWLRSAHKTTVKRVQDIIGYEPPKEAAKTAKH